MTAIPLSMGEPVFRTSYRVIYGDTDAAGVMYNANYLRLFEIGRTEMIREQGMAYRDLEAAGYVLPVSECHLRFKAPARYDDLLAIETCLAELRRFTMRFHYRVRREGEKGALALGYTVHACVDRRGRLTPLPEALVRRLEKILARS